MSIKSKLEKILAAGIVSLAVFLGSPSKAEAQQINFPGGFVGPTRSGIGIRAGPTPGTECRLQYGNHPPYGNHINFACQRNNVEFLNYHIRPQDYVRALPRAAPAVIYGAGQAAQFNLMQQGMNRCIEDKNRPTIINRCNPIEIQRRYNSVSSGGHR